MTFIIAIVVLVVSYLIGAVPFGLITVWMANGKDLRKVASGRTGGTNAMRAAGVPAGVATAVLDCMKGFCAVWIARALMPSVEWITVAAPLAAILGHNYSIFLVERDERNHIKLRGGAGGATCLGGSMGLWPPSLLIILPLTFAVWYGIGYASIATMIIALLSIIIFTLRSSVGSSPIIYVLFGIISEVMLVWALRPNLTRLLNGTERLVGWRARRQRLKTRANTR
jgi:glycerol-3-phosphate acyltransferase PlsY